jgi:hypothetical protein
VGAAEALATPFEGNVDWQAERLRIEVGSAPPGAARPRRRPRCTRGLRRYRELEAGDAGISKDLWERIEVFQLPMR